MRVLAVSDFYHPRSGGVERVVHETAQRLPRLGDEVEVLTRRLHPEAEAKSTVDGVTVWRVGPGPRALPLEFLALRREVKAWARWHLGRFDLIHVHLSFVALPLLAAARATGLPVVATFYGPWDQEYRVELADPAVPSRWPGWLRPRVGGLIASGLHRWQRRVLGQADDLIVLSGHSATELDHIQPGRVPIEVPGGVDLVRFRPRDLIEARRRLGLDRLLRSPRAPLIVAVRRLVPRMGLDGLVDACMRLRQERPDLALAIAGNGPMAAGLRERATSTGFDSLVLLGHVADDDLPWLYAAADVVAMPTRALEGFGLPVLEAWACGIPVAGTGVGALAETIGRLDPSLVASDLGSESLAEAIIAGLRLGSPGLAERARELAESYGWEKVAARLHAVYHHSMSRGSPA